MKFTVANMFSSLEFGFESRRSLDQIREIGFAYANNLYQLASLPCMRCITKTRVATTQGHRAVELCLLQPR